MMNYLVGLVLGMITFVAVNKVFPPPGLGIEESMGAILEGIPQRRDEISDSSDLGHEKMPQAGISPSTSRSLA